VKLNDDTSATDQFYPALAVSEDGTVAASWYDRRLDPNANLLIDRFADVLDRRRCVVSETNA